MFNIYNGEINSFLLLEVEVELDDVEVARDSRL